MLRPFNLDVKNRFLMVLVYYRFYITYTLNGFLCNLDQSNIYPKEVENVSDLGFLGAEKDYLEQISSLLIKKKKENQDLILEEKEYNRIQSKKRIIIGHAIYRLKVQDYE